MASGSRSPPCVTRAAAARSAMAAVSGVITMPIAAIASRASRQASGPGERDKRLAVGARGHEERVSGSVGTLDIVDGPRVVSVGACPAVRSGRWHRGSAFPLVAQAVEFALVVDAARYPGVATDAGTARGDDQFAVPDRPDGHFLACA